MVVLPDVHTLKLHQVALTQVAMMRRFFRVKCCVLCPQIVLVKTIQRLN